MSDRPPSPPIITSDMLNMLREPTLIDIPPITQINSTTNEELFSVNLLTITEENRNLAWDAVLRLLNTEAGDREGVIISDNNRHYLISEIDLRTENTNERVLAIRLNESEYDNIVEKIEITTEETCSICTEEIKDNCVKTKCGHLFHNDCLKKYLTQYCTRPICPNCRSELTAMSSSLL